MGGEGGEQRTRKRRLPNARAGARERARERASIKKSKIYDPACRRPRLPVVMSPPFPTPAPDEFVPRDAPPCEYLRPFYRRAIAPSRNRNKLLVARSHRVTGDGVTVASGSANGSGGPGTFGFISAADYRTRFRPLWRLFAI